VDNVLGFALGAMFVNKTFDGHSKPEAEAMIKVKNKGQTLIYKVQWVQFLHYFQEVTSAFISGLHAADWMDNKVRRQQPTIIFFYP
jgi:hypothetical protein